MTQASKITLCVLVGVAALASKLAGGSLIGPALAAAFVGFVVGGPVFHLYKWALRIAVKHIRIGYRNRMQEQRSSTG